MAYHNHTLGGLLYLLDHATDNEGLHRDTLSAYAEQTNGSLTSYFLDIDCCETAENEAMAVTLYELLALVRAAEVAASYAQAATLQDLGRMIRKLAARAGVALTVQVE